MDAVYILGTGSVADNEELRYSVRSLCLNMLDLETVYIVGPRVDFLPHAVHVPAEDIFPKKWQNILSKMRLAASLGEVSEEFLLMFDDYFMLEAFLGAELPFYANARGNGGPNGVINFGVHAPKRMKKEWLMQMPLTPEVPGDFMPSTFYCNFYKAPPTLTSDFSIRHGVSMPSFEKQTKNRPLCAISNATMLDAGFREWIDSLFPDQCRFEVARSAE